MATRLGNVARSRERLVVFCAAWAVLGLLMVDLPTAMAAAQGKGELYAVVVGLTRFQDSRIGKLTISDRDAKDVHSFLKEREKLFSRAHIRLLVNEEATRDNLTAAFRDFLKPAGKDDLVLIYLSGHGAADPERPDEFYFLTYDTNMKNLFGTAVWMNQQALFKGIDSDRVLLIADACHSGGFSPGIDRAIAKEADSFFSLFNVLKGRMALTSSRFDELSYEAPSKFGNSVFTHFFLKGLRGDACKDLSTGTITANNLYSYVYDSTRSATNNKQNPQFYFPKGQDGETPVFRVPVHKDRLNIKVQFVHKDDADQEYPLTNESVLRSGQRVGLSFRPESDCYVYVLWWDSTGNVGRLFPNPKLTEGTGEARAGQSYWLPSKGSKHWYVLDKNPGEETVYLVASRARNTKIENLYEKLASMAATTRTGAKGQEITTALEQEVESIMGFEEHTISDARGQRSTEDTQRLSEAMETEVGTAGAEAVFKVKFKHINP
ncbi:MAG: DUF4384 domain-containing protein [Desulfomonilaceae bacterium]|jgi:hypothetical protein